MKKLPELVDDLFTAIRTDDETAGVDAAHALARRLGEVLEALVPPVVNNVVNG